MQRSRWDIRPLSEEQLDYAALDTAFLPALYRKLGADLRGKGLEKEVKRHFVGLAEVAWQPRTFDRLGHRKLPGYGQLSPEQKERIRRLYRWRFEKAKEMDLACFMLLPDPKLTALARLEDPSLRILAGPGLLSGESLKRFGVEILESLQPQ